MGQSWSESWPKHTLSCMDESALDATVETQTHKIISSHCCDQSYAAQRGESHITFVALIATGGWHLPHLAIVKTKSIVRVLATQYGLPAKGWAHVVASTSGYINQELFQYWVDEIMVPGVAAKRREFVLPPDTPTLLLLDGCLANSKWMSSL